MRLYEADPGSVLFVSAPEPFDLESRAEEVMALDPETFARAGLRVREDLAAALVLDETGARALADGRTGRDRRREPLRHALPARARAPDQEPREAARAVRPAAEPPRRPRRPVRGQAAHPEAARAPRADASRRACRPRSNAPSPRPRSPSGAASRARARDLVARALAIDPASKWGRYRALSAEGDGPGEAFADGNGLILEARRLHAARDWQGLARLDERLARLGPRDPASVECLQLRVDWRIGSGDGAASAEAVELIDLAPFGGAELLARRALAGAHGVQPGVASQSLEHLASQLSGRGRVLTPLALEWALAALDAIPESERSAELRGLKPRLVRMRERSKPRQPA